MDLTNDDNEFTTASEVAAIKATDAAVLAGKQRRRDHIAELEMKITTLAANINAAKYQWLRLLAEFDRIEGWGEDAGISSTANWLSFKCGITPNAARENVRVARALPELPLISAAFAAGRLSYSKVRAMTRAATPENEEYFVMVARHGTGAHMEKLVRLRARTMKLNDPDASQRAFESRSLDWHCNEDGTVVIRARLMADQAEAVIGAIQGIAAEMQRQAAAEAGTLEESLPVENREQGTGAPPLRIGISAETHRTQLRADALERLAQWWNQNGDIEDAQTADHREDRRNETGQNKIRQNKIKPRKEQSLGETMAAVESIRKRRNSKNRPHTIVVHVDAADLGQSVRLDLPEPADRTTDSHHTTGVSSETLSRIGCDAALIASIDDADGKPLNIGRRRRTLPAAMRRALDARDTGCTFPGCSHTEFVDAHHIKHWCHGGKTRLDNLILLCRRHHRLLHEGGFTVSMTDGHPPVFYSLRGNPVSIAGDAHGIQGNAAALGDLNHDNGIEIDTETVATLWDGIHPDWSTMVEGTIPKDFWLRSD